MITHLYNIDRIQLTHHNLYLLELLYSLEPILGHYIDLLLLNIFHNKVYLHLLIETSNFDNRSTLLWNSTVKEQKMRLMVPMPI